MANYSVADNEIGVHDKTLVANTVDTVTFADDLEALEVLSDGNAAIYFTVDGSDPTVGGNNTYKLPAVAAVQSISRIPTSGPTTVKLISKGTPTYDVTRV